MNARETDNNTIDLMDYVRPLIPRWKLLVVLFFLGGVGAFFISRALPKQFRSSAVVFVQQNSGAASLLKNLPVSLGAAGGANTGYITTLLDSDSMHLRIINRLGLTKNKFIFTSETPNLEKALDVVSKMMAVTESKAGAITISVTATDPNLAANMANKCVDLLGSFVVTASQKKVDFTAKRLDETGRDLDRAENDLMLFLQHNDVTAIDEQTKGMISQLVNLDGQILTMQAQLRAIDSELQNAADLNNLADQEVRRKALQASLDYVQQQREALKAKLNRLPSIGSEYARIQRRIEVLSKTYELLTEQYQMARVTQKGEDGDYQVIDRARPNPKAVGPRNMLNATLGAFGVFIIAALMLNIRAGAGKGPSLTTRPIPRPADRDVAVEPAKRG